jgi:hypothetical protein
MDKEDDADCDYLRCDLESFGLSANAMELVNAGVVSVGRIKFVY